MRRLLLAVAVGFSSGPAAFAVLHGLAHEREVAHVHPHAHDDDGHHHEGGRHHGDAEHEDGPDGHEHGVLPALLPSLTHLAPRLDAPAPAVAPAPLAVPDAAAPRPTPRDLAPPAHAPSPPFSSSLAERAPPA